MTFTWIDYYTEIGKIVMFWSYHCFCIYWLASRCMPWYAFLVPRQDRATPFPSCSVCCLRRVLSWGLRNYPQWKETAFPTVMASLLGQSSSLTVRWEGTQRPRPLAPTWDNSDGSSQPQSSSWKQLLLLLWWHHSSPPSSAQSCFSKFLSVLLEASPSKPPIQISIP